MVRSKQFTIFTNYGRFSISKQFTIIQQFRSVGTLTQGSALGRWVPLLFQFVHMQQAVSSSLFQRHLFFRDHRLFNGCFQRINGVQLLLISGQSQHVVISFLEASLVQRSLPGFQADAFNELYHLFSRGISFQRSSPEFQVDTISKLQYMESQPKLEVNPRNCREVSVYYPEIHFEFRS